MLEAVIVIVAMIAELMVLEVVGVIVALLKHVVIAVIPEEDQIVHKLRNYV